VHIVGSWARGTGDVHGVALAAADGTAAFFDPTAMTPEDEQAFAGWLADPEHCKALHDSKGPSHAFASRGWDLQGVTSDTELSAYIALPGQRSFDLADLTLRFLHRELRTETADGQLSFDGGDEQAAADAAMLRAPRGHRPRRRARQ
jgi:DNA polymerase-1